MTDQPEEAEYMAALCHMKERGLVPYQSDCIVAGDNAEATQIASRWATAVGFTGERTWLQVTLDGIEVYSRELRAL